MFSTVSEFYIKPKKLEAIEKDLKSQGEREHLLFLIPLETGMTFLEMLNLKISDLRGKYIHVLNPKTNEVRCIPLSRRLHRIISTYLQKRGYFGYLLGVGEDDQMDSKQAFFAVARAGSKVMESCHHEILRKMYGYIRYTELNVGIEQLTNWYGFNDVEDTLDFIGVRNKKLVAAFKQFGGL